MLQINEMSLNVFGNYIVQKMIEISSDNQLKKITAVVQENFMALSYDTFGCRVIQKLFDQISFEEDLICQINEIHVKDNLK
jgi:pumilio RNA-binding family